MQIEGFRVAVRMMVENPFTGFERRYVKVPPRNVVPKPLQKPHPPLWMACSRRESILEAARLGLGALTFSFASPSEARQWVADYYATIENECEPLGYAVNPNIAIAAPFSVRQGPEARGGNRSRELRLFRLWVGTLQLFRRAPPGKKRHLERLQNESKRRRAARIHREPLYRHARESFVRPCANSRRQGSTR